MEQTCFHRGDALTLTILTAVGQSVAGTLCKVDGRFLQLRVPSPIPCGSLLRIENGGGDMVLGEAVQCERGPHGLTIVKAEHALPFNSLEGIRRYLNAASVCNSSRP